jgi:hypothetical protein
MKTAHIAPLILLLALCGVTCAQEKDSYALLTEPLLERPFTLHKNILTASATYGHFIGNNYFDADGTRLPFNESVRSMIENRFQFVVGYGILEYLEIQAAMDYRDRYETLPTYFVSNIASIGTENTTFHYRGLTNLALAVGMRLPIDITGFDHRIQGGLLLPFPDQSPGEPSHSITLYSPSDPGGSYDMEYMFNPSPGLVGTFYHAGIDLRYKTAKFGLSLAGRYTSPLGEVETYAWIQRRDGDVFRYEKSPYTLYPDRHILTHGEVQAQLFPWFAVFGGYRYHRILPGWTDMTGQQVRLDEQVTGTLTLGFEIQVATSIRMHQHIQVPLTGKETYSEFAVLTGIQYSIVPFTY